MESTRATFLQLLEECVLSCLWLVSCESDAPNQTQHYLNHNTEINQAKLSNR